MLAVGTGGWFARSLAREPRLQDDRVTGGTDLRERVTEFKNQLQQMQRHLTRLEAEIEGESRLGNVHELRSVPGEHNAREPRTVPGAPGALDTSFLANRFKFRIPFELGQVQSQHGGRIEIREVWGTRPRIEIGGQYLVKGRYSMPPGERGKLYFYTTAEGAWNQTATLDLQLTELEDHVGEFALIHGMEGHGYFHLILTSAQQYSRWFANVYFGTGENVLRDRH
jgi:hypothetical protein